MSYRRHPTKKDHWQFFISQGRRKKQLTFCREFDSEAEAALYHAELQRAYRPLPASAIVPTIKNLVPDFLSYYQTVAQPSTVDSWIRSWKNLEPYFGHIRPNCLAQTMIQHYKQQRLIDSAGIRGGTVSKRTINKEISYLASLITWAASDDSGNIIDPLPFKLKGFPGRQTRSPKPRVLTEDEVDRLLAAMAGSSKGLAACLYYAGLRFSEAAHLTRENVDMERKILHIRGKGDKERIVPILPELEPYLKGDKPGHLFLSPVTQKPYKDIRTSLKNAAARTGITKHVHPHLLRHCFGAHGIKNISLRAMQIIMGHSTPVVTQRYTQIAEATLSLEMNRFRSRYDDGLKKKKRKAK